MKSTIPQKMVCFQKSTVSENKGESPGKKETLFLSAEGNVGYLREGVSES